MGEPRFEKDGWCYLDTPDGNGDCRKLVTLEQDGMTWIGVRAWSGDGWLNNSEPSPSETVKAWRDMPKIARGWWDRGKLMIPPYGDEP